VAAAAVARWPAGASALDEPLRLTVAFLHSGQPIDVDNMLKPTLDGLIGVSYVDDALLEQVLGVRQDLQVELQLDRLSAVLLGAVVTSLSGAGPFMYLRLSPPVEFEELLG